MIDRHVRATHETGHLILAWYYNVPFYRIEIHEQPNGFGGGLHLSIPLVRANWAQVVVLDCLYAGYAAVHLWHPEVDDELARAMANEDHADAEREFPGHNPTPAIARATSVLREQEPLMHAVRDVLLQQDEISGPELLALVYANARTAWVIGLWA